MSKYLSFNNTYWNSNLVYFQRSDNTDPLGPKVFDSHKSLRTSLGVTIDDDYVGWANSFAPFSFKTVQMDIAGTGYVPISGDFDNDGRADILWYWAGDTTARIWWGRADRTFDIDNRVGFFPATSYTNVFAGDFDNNGYDDIFMYKAGGGGDYVRFASSGRTFGSAVSHPVNNTLIPIVGNFDNSSGDDIFWYSTATAAVNRWYSLGSQTSFNVLNGYAVDPGGPFEPIVGNFDGSLGDDIFWYVAGASQDRLWYSVGGTSFSKVNAENVSSTYAPISGDFDGDGHGDIYWDSAGSTVDFIWAGDTQVSQFEDSRNASVYGVFLPVSGDFDGNGMDDIYWYRN
jgi:hypothetical protein